jgi:hypothetical protein
MDPEVGQNDCRMWDNSFYINLAVTDLLISYLVCSFCETSLCPKCCTRPDMQGLGWGMSGAAAVGGRVKGVAK